ncbi:MAG TPA: DUF1697 domain-containing protein [Acidobacteriota bacterium]
MPKYVAFLRAINVGGHTVKMGHLRRLFEAMGFSNVETFIASGNVIFDSTSKSTNGLEKKIGTYLRKTFGYQVATFIRSIPELTEIARYKPFPDSELNAEGDTLYIAFLPDKPGKESKKKLLAFATAIDDLHVYGREVYWLRRKRVESKFVAPPLEKTLGMQATLRNSTTVKRILSRYS